MPKKNGIVNTSQEFFSSVKKPKDQNEIFRPTNLKQGQISDIWLKNANLTTLVYYRRNILVTVRAE